MSGDDVPPRRHSRNRVTPDGTARLRSVPAALAELSYRSSAQALVQQEAALNELRSRTGTLLAANAVAASFLGAAALKGGRLGAPAGLAVVCFALSLGAALFILLPRTGLRFSISGPVLYKTLYEYRDDAEEIHRRTAYWLEEFWSSNQATFDGLYGPPPLRWTRGD
jgi:hypothetical protein